jgi:hypothetical protein
MEERSHLGLDDEAAEKVRNTLHRLILVTEGTNGIPPSPQLEEPSAEDRLIA